MPRKNFAAAFVVTLALVITGACGRKGSGGSCINPVAPGCEDGGEDNDGDETPPPHPADSPIYSVPLPGSSKKFWWFIDEIKPPRGSTVVPGEPF